MNQIVSLSQLCREKLPPMLIDGLLPENGIVAIQGKPGTGKSFFALEIALAVATGTHAFTKFPARRPRRVLYVAADAPKWDIGAQARKLLAGRNILPPELEPPSGALVHYIKGENEYEADLPVDPIMVWVDPRPLLSRDDWAHELITTVAEGDYGVVIIDTLMDMHRGNENDNGWMSGVLNRLKPLRELCAVLVIHHVTKPSENVRQGIDKMRGGSVIGGTVDGMFELVSRGSDIIKAQVGKQRAVRLEPFSYWMDWNEDRCVMRLDETREDDQAAKVRKAVLTQLGAGPARWTEMLRTIEQVTPNLKDSGRAFALRSCLKQLEREAVAVKFARGAYRLERPIEGS